MTESQVFSVMPPQKISIKKKNKAWKEQCVESICSSTNTSNLNGRSNSQRKRVNYDLVNSIINESDFAYVIDSYGLKDGKKVGKQPGRLRSYNLIKPKIELLKGEEIKRTFKWMISTVSGNAVSEKQEKESEMLRNVVMKEIITSLGIELSEDTDLSQIPALKDFDKWKLTNLRDVREIWANRLLEYIIKEDNLQMKFNQGWEHALISSEEIYYSGIVNNTVRTRSVNPLMCDFDKNPDDPNVENGDWFKEDRWMTKGQIRDEFAEYLTDEQLRLIDEGDLKQNLSNQMFPGYAYSEQDIKSYERGNLRSNSTHFLVSHVCWKSMKKIGFVSNFAEGIEDLIVDESFVLTQEMKELGIEVEWKWVSEIWEGTKIANNFYINIRPSENQRRSMDNPYEVKLPYVGMVYNCTNSEQTSIVDLLKPHQYMYNIMWFRLETEVAKAKGKKLIIDLAQIPRSEGFDLESWLYFFDNAGVGLINSFEEGSGKLGQGKTSNFNQFTQVDMTLSQSIQQYIGIITKIELMIDDIVGISKQRQGAVSPNETAQGIDSSISQSANITEPLFYIHNEIKRKVLTNIAQLSKVAFKGTKKIHYFTDDLERISMEIDADKFADSDYGLFVTDSAKEHRIMMKLEGLVNHAISSGVASLSDVIKTYKSNSIAEISKEIEHSEAKKQQQQQAEQERQLQANQEAQQQQLAFEREKMDREDRNKQLDRENDLRKAIISKGEDPSTLMSEIELGKQMIESGKVRSKEEADRLKHELEKEKVMNEKEKVLNERQKAFDNRTLKERELDLKDKEIESKERTEKLKAKTALKNKVSGEK